jgi:Transposase
VGKNLSLRILGIDVSKSSISVCLLTEKPKEPRQFYYKCHFYCFKADASGIKALLELKPDLAIMEPTGVNYGKLWGTHLARAGVEVRLVGHQELRSYRSHHLALPDKDDDADALALACYAFDYFDYPKRFVQIREPIVTRIRELVLRLAHLNRIQSPIINRLRQDLAWQFPEVSKVHSRRSDSVEVPLLWGWLARERTSKRYDDLYQNSCGLGLTSTVHNHAKRLCDLQREEREIEIELNQLVSDEKFSSYRRVFSQFGFGLRLEAIIISQIYPFEAFLNSEGLPETTYLRGRKSGKPTKRYLSQRRYLS